MDRNVMLSGDLQFLGMAELLQLLAANSGTGVLRLTNPFAQGPALITFVEGSPIHAAYRSEIGLEVLYSLFGWTTGRFEFSREQTNGNRTIQAGQLEIVLEGLRMLDEGLIKKLGSDEWEGKDPSARADAASRLPLLRKPLTHYAFTAAEESFSKGVKVMEEGEYGNWIWMVLKGTAEMSIRTSAGPTKILQAGQGAFIGNISSMMFSNRRRIATFTATENIRVGVLDPAPIHEEYSTLSNPFQRVLLSLDNRLREVIQSLAGVYSGMNESGSAFQDQKNPFGKGTKLEKPILLTKGTATIISNNTEKPFLLMKLHQDDFVGPLPFFKMGHEPGAASVVFSDDMEFVPLDPQEMQQQYDQLDGTLRSIVDFTVNCISIATMHLFRNWR